MHEPSVIDDVPAGRPDGRPGTGVPAGGVHPEHAGSAGRYVDPPAFRTALREAITRATRRPEPALVPELLAEARTAPAQQQATRVLARRLVTRLRATRPSAGRQGLVQGLLQEFSLDSQEGIALMCLAEALLRIPDAATRDALIRDKVGSTDWESHLGASPSMFVNAATWGLVVTGRLVATHSATGLGGALARALARGGEPVIRGAVDLGMRMMGEQFVAGETIEEALARAATNEDRGYAYSYDMLGEAALTGEEAERYLHAYEQAIEAIGVASAGRGIYDGPGISIKLSALHPRYGRAQRSRVDRELYPRLLQLARGACARGIGMSIDAEECARLELSLDLIERLCFEPTLAGWDGIGVVVQAYQRRCLAVVDYLIDLAQRSDRRLMIRLVKGAYWDAEIKRAQLDGLDDFPVFTRKPYTDLAYLACARRLLEAPAQVYPQFATHNAQTLAAIHQLAGAPAQPHRLEFQCLHGMGEPLYDQVVGRDGLGWRCRIYAPVGRHDALLAYLVRRLLENGANSSFINRVADEQVSIDALTSDPVEVVLALGDREGVVGGPHPAIAAPTALFGARRNFDGLDFADERALAALEGALVEAAHEHWRAAPMLAVPARPEPARPVVNPADRHDRVGEVCDASAADVRAALAAAEAFAAHWAGWSPAARAAALERAADLLQQRALPVLALLAREAGKTLPNAVAELREAVDFLRYYAGQVRNTFDNRTHRPLGPVLCISPWNFPLAIFTGQVAAALAAGNVVLAKPAEQTPLVAAVAVAALHDAGVPAAALQLLPGDGARVGAALAADARVQGVLFTGSTEVARLLQAALAQRLGADGGPVPLVAETGGQNAMVVDSSALPEQVVADVLASAFDSAGQRCSALRVLCVQHEAADRLLSLLEGAMRELRIGDPRLLATDVGPVIDADAQAAIEMHVATMALRGRRVLRPVTVDPLLQAGGRFVVPTVIEIEHLGELEREVFGPVLHVLRFDRRELDALLAGIRATGYGLTLGVHSRIDETVSRVAGGVPAGNVYVNRNIVGAVVGSQPFGGHGLSGTGPKAGGPLYLLRLLARRPADAAVRSVVAADAQLPVAPPVRGLPVDDGVRADDGALAALRDWLVARGSASLAEQCDVFARCSPACGWRVLPGPTGESNLYAVEGRGRVLCIAPSDDDRLVQLAAVLAVGAEALWPACAVPLLQRLPPAVRRHVTSCPEPLAANVDFDAMLLHGDTTQASTWAGRLADRRGCIVGLHVLDPGDVGIALERLVVERCISVNTAAAGGNAALMRLG